MMTTWTEDIEKLTTLLKAVSIRQKNGVELDTEDGFTAWCDATKELRRGRGTVYLIGNGASASMASHFATDLAKNASIRTQVFSDLSLITAISNDISYAEVFSIPLQRCASEGDMLIAISSSGRSPNILTAVAAARSLGMTVITLSAMRADNALRQTGDINLYVPAETYGYAETCHAAMLHRWLDMVEGANN